MKIFLYKFAIILFGVFLLFEFTIGSKLKHFERSLKDIISKQNLESIKEKTRKEMRLAIDKDVYLDPNDAKLISLFLEKIQKEIENLKSE